MRSLQAIGDRVAGIAAVGLGGMAIREAVRLYPYRTSAMVGDHLLFAVLGGLLVLFGLLLVVLRPERLSVKWPEEQEKRSILTVLGVLAVYLILLPNLGYVIATLLCSYLLFWGLSGHRWHLSLLWAVLTTGALYAVFVWWLNLALP